MGRFDKLSVYNSVEESGLVLLNYNPDVEVMKKCIKACASGGATVFEFTNRGDFAHSVFSELHELHCTLLHQKLHHRGGMKHWKDTDF